LTLTKSLERTEGEPNPGFLLGLVLHLATGWVSVSPEFESAIDVADPE
jgi:hypothetical protein